MYEIDIDKCLKEITGKDNIKLSAAPPGIEGDLSTNAAMVSGIDAGKIADKLKQLECIEDAQVVGPGFVNIKITDQALINEIVEIAGDPDNYGRGEGKGKIILEMVSSNPTGPLHIGHGRGAVIGDTIGRIMEWVGYDVYREYYVNNAGKQMNLLGESVLNSIQEKEVPEKGYKGEYIKEIAARLKDCKTVEECNKRAGEMILQQHKDVLEEFGVVYDNFFYETELIKSGSVEDTIEYLKKKGLTYSKDNALWFKSTEFGDDMDRVLIKNDGEFTYFASDCAYHKDKAERFPRLINIWGADHHGYMGRVNAFWEAMGYNEEKELNILLYQLVDLIRDSQKISMSTRAGEFVTIDEVIKEVGKDTARFFMLMRGADAPLEFDLDLAKQESKKNPVYYVQYSHARICSVFKKKEMEYKDIDIKKADQLGKEEREVIKMLAHFPYLLNKCCQFMAPHLITEYLRETSTVFHKYYDTVRVIGNDKEAGRLVLLKAVKDIIKNGLDLAGVSAPERM